MNFKIATLSSILLATLVTGCIGESSETKISQMIEKVIIEKPELIINALTEYRKREEAKQADTQKEILNNSNEKITNDKHSLILGNPDGDITLVAFKDYRCGYCQKAWPILQELIAKDKNLRVVFKEFAVLGAESEMAARFALASSLQGVDKYRAFNAALITHKGAYDIKTLKEIAKSNGIDVDKMEKDAGEKFVSDAIAENMQLGAALGIQGTPAFVVGKTLIPGAVPLDTLEETIKKEREATKKSVTTDTKPAE